MFDVIAFDADDTLWHNETLYLAAQDKIERLLSSYQSGEAVERVLHETEIQNLRTFGYGVKGYALSMIEAAIDLSAGQIRGEEIQKIVDVVREMLDAPVRLFDHVPETLAALSEEHALMLITKGDLFDQENKLAKSGLADRFQHVEIVSEKVSATYRAILSRHDIAPSRFLMVGNSLKSDILPVVAVGGQAVYIPYELTWAHETHVDGGGGQKGYFQIDHIGQLPALVGRLSGQSG